MRLYFDAVLAAKTVWRLEIKAQTMVQYFAIGIVKTSEQDYAFRV